MSLFPAISSATVSASTLSAKSTALKSQQDEARAEVLAQCAAAAASWEVKPGRNLVLLFDGTGNILGNEEDTNVVRLLRALRKHASDEDGRPAQIVYYDPGVGTSNEFPAASIGSKFGSIWRKAAGLAMGSGAFENIVEAYEFLVQHYREGDRIFLLGFSRGAFTARAVGGMLNMYGLVYANGLPLIHLMVSTYFAKPDNANRAGKIKNGFANDIVTNFALGRRPLIHFTGVWDTVETIGSGFLGGIKITNTASVEAKRFVHVRHALALHEIRCKYSPRTYCPPDYDDAEKIYRSFDERWFRGAHSDIGGSYNRDCLAVRSLHWMINEAVPKGLLVDVDDIFPADASEVMHDEAYESPYWVWTGLSSRERPEPHVIDPTALPLDAALPADREPRSSPFFRYFGWILTLIVMLLGWKAAQASALVCTFQNTPSWASTLPTLFQLVAPWHAELGAKCSVAKLHVAMAWDWYFLAAYFFWMPYPITWALRRLAARAIPLGLGLTVLQKNVQWLMLALICADAIENIASYLTLDYGLGGSLVIAAAWTTAFSSAVKMLSLTLLVWVFITGSTCFPSPSRAPAAK